MHQLHYFSGPNYGVVLNKHAGWIFCSPFIGENTFQNLLLGEKKACGRGGGINNSNNKQACGYAYQGHQSTQNTSQCFFEQLLALFSYTYTLSSCFYSFFLVISQTLVNTMHINQHPIIAKMSQQYVNLPIWQTLLCCIILHSQVKVAYTLGCPRMFKLVN